MGADYIDYIVADNVVIPPELTDFYSEKMIYLPHCFSPADHKNSAAHLLDGGDHVAGIRYPRPLSASIYLEFMNAIVV